MVLVTLHHVNYVNFDYHGNCSQQTYHDEFVRSSCATFARPLLTLLGILLRLGGVWAPLSR